MRHLATCVVSVVSVVQCCLVEEALDEVLDMPLCHLFSQCSSVV